MEQSRPFIGAFMRSCASLLLAAGLVSSCSYLPSFNPVSDSSGPFTVQILEDSFHAQRLSVSGIVHAHATESFDRIALRVTVSDRGKVVATRLLLPCIDSFPPVRGVECQLGVLPSGRELPFQVSLAVPHGSDYQLELLWGDDAEAVRPKVVLADVAVQNLSDGCGVAPCQQGFLVQGTVRNVSRYPVSGVTLGVGYVAVTGAVATESSPGAEESLRIPTPIQPSEQRPFRIRVGSALSATEAARVRPSVRIVGEG